MKIPALANIGELIVSTPGTVGGRPRLAGTRIPVSLIAIRHNQGVTPKQFLKAYPHLDLARIYAALACYYANKAAIDADIAEEQAFFDEQFALQEAQKAAAGAQP